MNPRCQWYRVSVSVLPLAFALGCGQSDYLPKPRPTAGDEPVEEAVAADPPSGNQPPAGAGKVSPDGAKADPSTARTKNVAGPNLATATGSAPPATATAAVAGPPTLPGKPGAAVEASVEIPVIPEHAALGVLPVKPGMNLTVEQRRRHAIGCLKAISVALKRYLDQHRQFPNRCRDSEFDGDLLSWRVELLPYLGYQELHATFKLDQKWDSLHNRAMLAQIPPVFRSAERGDNMTNFQLFTGRGTPYTATAGTPLNLFLDGPQSTLLLAETDDDAAVPWTKPEDLAWKTESPRSHLFGLRQDGFFGLFADLQVHQIRPAATDNQLRAILSLSGDEMVNLSELSGPPSETPLAASPPVGPATANPALAGNTAPAAGAASAMIASDQQPRAESKPPLPLAGTLSAAEGLVRGIYEPKYKQAKTIAERRSVATTMLSEAETVRLDLGSYYTMLRTAREIATSLGDVDTAKNAHEKIAAAFEVDPVEFTLPWLETAAKRATTLEAVRFLYETATSEHEAALLRDDFPACDRFQTLALALARKSGKEDWVRAATAMAVRAKQTRTAYNAVAPALHTLLRSPHDPLANSEVGRYLCLVKQDWERGVPHLAKGNEGQLKVPALMELQQPTAAEVMAGVGDAYWSVAESCDKPNEAEALRKRAGFWYRKSIDSLPEGLRRILVRERLASIEQLR